MTIIYHLALFLFGSIFKNVFKDIHITDIAEISVYPTKVAFLLPFQYHTILVPLQSVFFLQHVFKIYLCCCMSFLVHSFLLYMMSISWFWKKSILLFICNEHYYTSLPLYKSELSMDSTPRGRTVGSQK